MKFSNFLKKSFLVLAASLVGISSQVPVFAEENVAATDPKGTKIVLATNNSGDGRAEWLKNKFSEKGFNVEIVPLGGSDATARVIAEVENPTINVVWGPSNDNFDLMIEAAALSQWTPEWADKVADYDSKNGYSYPYEIQPKMWLANKDQFGADNLPKTINDLFEKEEFKGKYTVPTDFGGATNRAIIGSILGQYLDENGELGVSEEGWQAITAFFDNGIRTPEGENDYQNMIAGKTPITFSYASGIYKKMEEFGEANIIYFENGQPDNTNEVGVVNNNDQEVLDESIRLANYLGSAEFMGAYAAENGSIVVNSEAINQMTAISKEIFDNYKSQDLDWAKINELMDDWVAKIELEIY
ncbi:ABC transporter substrate-binding protein [Ignavigranum ruoffiae]|uniref:ABC transporter substrate-binding protein n=1 Tax=Ignavigranum ruoffiae TaxID=89093 RepID=UPI00204D6183|nr:ABC transporter substrate-binding protein [Ignavigranum ruoffiae]UPQ86329.1 ABC transporter substrate-binding protein [Ignavigranum ruoffiae]